MSSAQPPLIGITAGILKNSSGVPVSQIGQAYIQAVQHAGGVPVIISAGIDESSLSELVSRLDGFILSGGADIDPQRFNGKSHPRVAGVSPERDRLEFALLKKVIKADKPLLAICRGIQVLNVGFGGTLYTHIEDQLKGALKHDWFPGYPRDRRAHNVSLEEGSFLGCLFGAGEISVNSLHHQGIDRLGNGLKPIGYAPDGLVEAVVVRDARFALGVQWHPECLPDDPHSQALFRVFVETCDNGSYQF